ncbi:unnamed protein product [Trifolium pratense]|uniref:Uncharacterized protein n=1 Tax=Trifolium pratense TaxID=57577 RepID=A0ACB0JI67_TRIPR|nr:unnamed protein product [Trifolium pratense]
MLFPPSVSLRNGPTNDSPMLSGPAKPSPSGGKALRPNKKQLSWRQYVDPSFSLISFLETPLASFSASHKRKRA